MVIVFVQVPNSNKIGLLYLLEKKGGENVHPIISSIFMEGATQAVENMPDVSLLRTQVFLCSMCFSTSIDWQTS